MHLSMVALVFCVNGYVRLVERLLRYDGASGQWILTSDDCNSPQIIDFHTNNPLQCLPTTQELSLRLL
eukprot:4035587-Amphidinium_carterae.1